MTNQHSCVTIDASASPTTTTTTTTTITTNNDAPSRLSQKPAQTTTESFGPQISFLL